MWLHDHWGWLGVEYHASNKQLFQPCWWVWQLSGMYSCLLVWLHLHGWEQHEKRYGLSTLLIPQIFTFSGNRPLSFISMLHSDNQSESTTKFYNSSKADVGGNMLTLTVYTEIWPDRISLDDHRLTKFSSSFNPFTEKDAPVPGWLLSLFYFFNCCELTGGGGYPQWSTSVCRGGGWGGGACVCACNVCVCVCARARVPAGDSVSVRVFACQIHFTLYD